MAVEPGFESRNSPIDGIDAAAEALFERGRLREKVLRGEATIEELEVARASGIKPPPDPKTPETPEEAEKAKLDAEVPENEDLPAEEPSDEEIPADPDPQALQEGESEKPAEEAFEISPETQITLPDGTETSFADLQMGYQRQSDYTRKTTELAEHRQQFEAKVAEAHDAFEQRVALVNGLAEQLQSHLQGSMPTKQQMEHLRQVDPGEYAARMEDMRAKQSLVTQAAEARQNMQAEAALRAEETRAARVPGERKALADKIPAFKKNFDVEYASLGRYAVASDGGELRPEEWDLVGDHRYVTLVWKAREYDKATRKTVPAVRKAMARKPRTVRSGSPSEAGQTQRDEVEATMAHLKANPDNKDAQKAAFLARERARTARRDAMVRRV